MNTVNEDLLRGIGSHVVDLNQFDDDLQEQILVILRRLEREIIEELRIVAPQEPGAKTARLARLERLLPQVRSMIATAYAEVISGALSGMEGVARLELDFINESMTRALGPVAGAVNLNTVGISPELLRTLAADTLVTFGDNAGAASVSDWFDDQSRKIQESISQHLKNGVLRGEGIPEMIRRIAGGGRYDGVMKIGRRWAEAVVRTGVTAISAESRINMYRQNDNVLKGFYQISTFDDRTTQVCIAYAGKGWIWGPGEELIPVGHSLPYKSGVPRHPNCRSVEAPWTKSASELGLSSQDFGSSILRQFDGKIPAGLDGTSLLKRGGVGYQDEVLGKGIASLWRSGAIKTNDLVDRNGVPRTLKNVRELLARRNK